MTNDEHEILIEKGLKLYDKHKYHESFPYLQKAYKLAPKCLCAMYNFANVLHMLEREEEAYYILLDIIDISPKEAKKECPHLHNAKGFIIDAHYLIFNVMIHGLGYSEEAFEYANRHLELRTRGVSSVWTKKQIQKEIADHKKYWKNEE